MIRIVEDLSSNMDTGHSLKPNEYEHVLTVLHNQIRAKIAAFYIVHIMSIIL